MNMDDVIEVLANELDNGGDRDTIQNIAESLDIWDAVLTKYTSMNGHPLDT